MLRIIPKEYIRLKESCCLTESAITMQDGHDHRYGTVNINGAPVTNSNIVDLVCDVVRCKRKRNADATEPICCQEFIDALRLINIFQEFIENPQHRRTRHDTQEGSSAAAGSTSRPSFPLLSAIRRRLITPVPRQKNKSVFTDLDSYKQPLTDYDQNVGNVYYNPKVPRVLPEANLLSEKPKINTNHERLKYGFQLKTCSRYRGKRKINSQETGTQLS